VSQSRRSLQEGGPAPAGPEFAAALLSLWGFPPGTAISPADWQGTNNRTFLTLRAAAPTRTLVAAPGYSHPLIRPCDSSGRSYSSCQFHQLYAADCG
jgi:hypothetical protein